MIPTSMNGGLDKGQVQQIPPQKKGMELFPIPNLNKHSN